MKPLTVEQAAPELGLSVRAVYDLCRGDPPKLSHSRVGASGGKILISEEDIREYLARCRKTAKEDVDRTKSNARVPTDVVKGLARHGIKI